MSLDGAVTNLASWAGNVMMPTMAGAFFAGVVYRYSKGGQFEQLLYGGFASLMCSGMLRALEGFVQNAGPTSADGYWTAVMNLVNWIANVILPVFALTQLAAMGMHSRNLWARCPSCAQIGRDRTGDNLAIQIKNPRFYKCWAGCTKEEIRAALGQPIRRQQAV